MGDSSMREKRIRNRRILFLAVAVLIVLSLVIGECCLLVVPVQ
jgi:predicted nucleic acid-binding Zn ribbon protein